MSLTLALFGSNRTLISIVGIFGILQTIQAIKDARYNNDAEHIRLLSVQWQGFRNMIVLLVEDEPLIAFTVSEQLEDAGYTVLSASNADDAILLLESRNDIRFLFTDIDMPGSMDGLKLASAVSQRWPPVKIIITTGNLQPYAPNIPAFARFVPKPYRIQSVIAAISSWAPNLD